MCNNFPNIRITEGNNFSIILPLISRTYVATRPIDEEIDPQQLQNVEVTFGGVSYQVQLTERGVQINLPATLAVGTYNILLTAEYLGSKIRAAYESAVTIVPWSEQSTAEQYIAGSPIVLRAAYVLSGAMTDAELEALKEEYREKNAQLGQAIADAEAAKREWEEKAAELDGVAQEATSQEILTAVENIDFSTLAKETTAQAARDAALALAPVAQAAEAYNTGKVQLAQNITAKGVPASANETLPDLAGKVSAIAQQPIILSPSEVGDMYAKQQFGAITQPNYWNLYEVLVQLLNDGRLLNYGGILLAEYYRGYDSFALSGAGAGGAYVVSDIENGQFKMYTNDTTHTWATEFDGKGNRWVAYCFADEYHNFQITDTNTSPRSIFIGRKVGTITSLVNGRLSKIIVPDGNSLVNFKNGSGFVQNWDKLVVLRNFEDVNGAIFADRGNEEALYLSAKKISASIFSAYTNHSTVVIDCPDISNNLFFFRGPNPRILNTIIIKNEDSNYRLINISGNIQQLKQLSLFDAEGCTIRNEGGYDGTVDCVVYIHYKINDKQRAVSLQAAQLNLDNGWRAVKDVVLKNDWCKPLNIEFLINIIEDGTTNNITEHILKRLKQDEPDCGDGVTITLGATNLAKLTSAESVQLLDDLTNIYGYTFA